MVLNGPPTDPAGPPGRPSVPLPTTVPGRWRERLSRFHGVAEIDGIARVVRVPGPGRMVELLVQGAPVRVAPWPEDAGYRTWGTVHLVEGEHGLVPIDAQLPNALAEVAIRAGLVPGLRGAIRREVPFGSGRVDLTVGDALVEVKGVTLLDEQAVARFPDAPTERGARQVTELAAHAADGGDAWLLFVVVVPDAQAAGLADRIDPAFAAAVREAQRSGVKIRALAADATIEAVSLAGPIPLEERLRVRGVPDENDGNGRHDHGGERSRGA